MNKTELGHHGQILTTKRKIKESIWDIQRPVAINTVFLIFERLVGKRDDIRLFSVCARLHYLSRLVYEGQSEIKKLKPEEYRKMLFEPHAESKDEVCEIIKQKTSRNSVSIDTIDDVFRCLMVIEKLWSMSIACLCEQVYIPELAYAFDYVIERKGHLPEPEFVAECSIFPTNFANYNYTEGIAEQFEDIMESIF